MSVIDSKIPNDATSWNGYKGSRVEEYIKERFTKVEDDVADAVLAGDDSGEAPDSYEPSSAEEATFAQNWKSASGATVDGKTQGSMVELYNMAKQGATAEEIREAMENLPDGQAVSAQVAVNTAKVTDLERKMQAIVVDVVEDGFFVVDENLDIGLQVTPEGFAAFMGGGEGNYQILI